MSDDPYGWKKRMKRVPVDPDSIEPLIHSHLDDELPATHPLAFEQVRCDDPDCSALLHAGNNECMQTWVETTRGNFCFTHFAVLMAQEAGAIDAGYGFEIGRLKE